MTFKGVEDAERKTRMRDTLGKFIVEYKILPVSGTVGEANNEPFFPRLWDQEGTKAEQFEVLESLWNFEMFCIARLGTKGPAFLPVIPISKVRTGDEAFELNAMLNLSESVYRYPLLTSLEVPDELMMAYLEFFRSTERIGLHLAADGTDPEAWNRIPWEAFDWTLKVHDWATALNSDNPASHYPDFHEKQLTTNVKPKQLTRKITAKYRRKLEKENPKCIVKGRQVGAKPENLVNQYPEIYDRAQHWIANYARII